MARVLSGKEKTCSEVGPHRRISMMVSEEQRREECGVRDKLPGSLEWEPRLPNLMAVHMPLPPTQLLSQPGAPWEPSSMVLPLISQGSWEGARLRAPALNLVFAFI